MREQVLDLAGGLDARALGHADIHQHDVGHRLLRPIDGLGPIGRLAHELDVGLLLEHHLETAPEQRVVVDHHDAQPLGRFVADVLARSPGRDLGIDIGSRDFRGF